MTIINRIHKVIENPKKLEKAYENMLSELFEIPLWQSGSVKHKRILWTQGKNARAEDRAIFASSGLYIWGIGERPLYIGITSNSFNKRFSRYIWQKKSQCNLAKEYRDSLVLNGINGLPAEVRAFGYNARFRGAERFANEGIENVWFALFPHDDNVVVAEVERYLIPVADTWNRREGLPPLLNEQHNRGND